MKNLVLVVVVLCSLSSVFGLGVETRSDTVLDRLEGGMRQIKASSLAELHELEDKDRTARAESIRLLLDLEELFSKQKIEHDRQTDHVSELANDVVPTLQNMIAQQSELEQQSTTQLETARKDMESGVEEASENVRLILTDIDNISALAQQAGEVVHNANMLSNAAAQFARVSSRQNYEGEQLKITCKSRDQLSSLVSQLLSHLQQSRDQELGHIEKLMADYKSYADGVVAVGSGHKQGNYTNKLEEAQNDLNLAQSSLATATQLLNDTADKIQRIQKYQSWMGLNLAKRFKSLLELVAAADLVIQQIDLLQIKLQVRAVTSS